MILQKKVPDISDGTFPAQDTDIFTYLCSSIGETLDSNRFDDPNNDLKDAVRLFKLYKLNGYNDGLFSSTDKENKRMKLLSLESFGNNDSWIIEKQWSDEDKEELGIKEKKNTASLSEFCDMLSDLNDSINGIISDLTIMGVS